MNRDNLLKVWIQMVVLSGTDFKFPKQIEFNTLIKSKWDKK